jgi:hypothetical protein
MKRHRKQCRRFANLSTEIEQGRRPNRARVSKSIGSMRPPRVDMRTDFSDKGRNA